MEQIFYGFGIRVEAEVFVTGVDKRKPSFIGS